MIIKVTAVLLLCLLKGTLCVPIFEGQQGFTDVTMCPPLDDIDNGKISYSVGEDGVAFEGDTCIYICDEGFIVTGDSIVRECQSDGTWSGSKPTCERLSCVPLEAPENGMIQCNGFQFEDTCIFTCDVNAELSGSASRTCQNDGTWSGTDAICDRDPAVCPQLADPDNGRLACSFNLEDSQLPMEGDTCIYICDDGFSPDGNVVRECLSNGSWSGVEATCVQLPCQVPKVPAHGRLVCSGFRVGDACTARCEPSYELIGNAIRTCQSDVTWSGTEPICGEPCSVQSVKAGARVAGRRAIITFSADTPHPGVTFQCKLDDKDFEPCESPFTYRNLARRNHRVIVQAVCPSRSLGPNKRVRFRIGRN